jgi:hypothetical protein
MRELLLISRVPRGGTGKQLRLLSAVPAVNSLKNKR